jgi:hypothetical protein
MSIPKNHHFVSKVLIKKFLGNDKMLYTYSKKDRCINEKPYHRFDFAEKDLNSVIDDNGELDRKSIEDNLNKYFESGFNKHYDLLIKGLEGNNFNDLQISAEYLIRMGIIGDMRTPENILETKYSIFSSLGKIINHFDDDLSNGFNSYIKKNSVYKNMTSVDYNEICDKVMELMGETIYSICYAPKNNYFFLPDNSSIQIRSKRETIRKLPNGQNGINTITPITTVIIPINSQILIIAESLEISPRSKNTINQMSKDDIILFNNLFIKHSRDKVICSNKEYLNNFIQQYVTTS